MKLIKALVVLLLCAAVYGQDAASESAATCDCSSQINAVEKAREEVKAKLQSLESSCSESAQKAKAEQEEKLRQLEEKLTATCAAEAKAAADASAIALSVCSKNAEAAQQQLQTVEAQNAASQQSLANAEAQLAATNQRQQELETNLAATQQKLKAAEAQVATAQQVVNSQVAEAAQKLQQTESKLAAAEQSSAAAQKQLEAAQLEAETKVANVQKKLLDTESQLSAAQQKLRTTEESLAKLTAASSARGADVNKLASELAAAKSQLAEAEAAWIPVRVQKHLAEGVEWSKQQYEAASSSEQGKKLLAAVEDGKVWVANALKPLEPHLKQVQPKLVEAKEAAEKAFNEAKAHVETFYEKYLKNAPVWQNLEAQWGKLNKELTTVITTQLRTAPAPFNAWADPVLVQYIVYTIVLLPLAFVLFLISSLLFGKSRQDPGQASGSRKHHKGGHTVVNLDGDTIVIPSKAMKRRK